MVNISECLRPPAKAERKPIGFTDENISNLKEFLKGEALAARIKQKEIDSNEVPVDPELIDKLTAATDRKVG